MKHSPIRPISARRYVQNLQEAKVKKLLYERAGGLCEKCGQPPDWRGLHPHEKAFRSQGGRLTLENSQMLCGKCHSAEHGIRESNADNT